MDPILVEAMLVRHHGAMKIAKTVTDPWELLAMVVAPDENVLRASLSVAQETGPSSRAIELSRMRRPKAGRDDASHHRPRSESYALLR